MLVCSWHHDSILCKRKAAWGTMAEDRPLESDEAAANRREYRKTQVRPTGSLSGAISSSAKNEAFLLLLTSGADLTCHAAVLSAAGADVPAATVRGAAAPVGARVRVTNIHFFKTGWCRMGRRRRWARCSGENVREGRTAGQRGIARKSTSILRLQ